jgi:hypothetical protein
MNECLCCSAPLLRHISHNHIYWYCSRCRQAMPVASDHGVALHQEFRIRTTLDTVLSAPIAKAGTPKRSEMPQRSAQSPSEVASFGQSRLTAAR